MTLQNFSLSPSLTEFAAISAKSEYLRRKQGIVDQANQSELLPDQQSLLDQLDAEYEEIASALNSLPHKPLTVEYVPVTASEAKGILASISAAFGLSTKDEAEILHIERQTIYAWVRGENDPSDENGRRLRAVSGFAKEWNKLCNLPARKFLRAEMENGKTLFSELCKEEFDPDLIRQLMREVASLVRKADEQNKKRHTPDNATPGLEYGIITLSAFIPKEEARQIMNRDCQEGREVNC